MTVPTLGHHVVPLLGVAAAVLAALAAAADNGDHGNGHHAGDWVLPGGFPPGHNGGVRELLVEPTAGKKPHIMMILFDDYGWSEAGWHRNYSIGGVPVPFTDEVRTPHMDALVRDGIELDRGYVYKCCSPTRSAVQSGRNPYHVNAMNDDMDISNPADPVSGFAGIPRNMTGLGTKMAAAGYATAFFGKFDAGMATPDHTPRGRGYHAGLAYFHHDNDYWTMGYQKRCNRTATTDLWRTVADNATHPEGPAVGFNSTCVGMEGAGAAPHGCDGGPHGDHWWGGYEDSLLEQHVIQTVERHDPTTPLFLFWAPHGIHAPLQAPQQYIADFDFIAKTDQVGHQRQLYHAMVSFADDAVGNVTAAIKAKGLWDDMIVVFMSDNGGWVSANGTAGGNNFPLKGGKYNNWEGGIRVNAFVSGGFLPVSQRGTKYEGLVAGWDWYATFCAFGGVDPIDHRAAAANLPAIDSVDMSGVIMGTTSTRPRTELAIGTGPALSNITTARPCASYSWSPQYDDPAWQLPEGDNCTTVSGIIVDDADGLWKLMTGDEKQYVTTGPHYPNSTTNFNSQDPQWTGHCGNGCLYNLRLDPLEAHNLARSMQPKVWELRSKLATYEASAFNPVRGTTDPKACEALFDRYQGFWGPFLK